MRRGPDLNPDHAQRELQRKHLCLPQLPSNGGLAVRVDALDLKHILRQIQPNGRTSPAPTSSNIFDKLIPRAENILGAVLSAFGISLCIS
jgi:hypothetical protein